MNYRSYNDLSMCVWKNLYKIPSNTDLLVGIPRSGMMVALMISKFTNIPCISLDDFIQKKDAKTTYSNNKSEVKINNVKNIIIIDDSISSGRTFSNIKNSISHIRDVNIKYLAVYYAHQENIKQIDICFEKVEGLRFFEWNFLFHPQVAECACFDIDGIVCRNPTQQENDDGGKYIDFIQNVKPLFRQQKGSVISCFITCRLEKYRKYTEEWLKKYFAYKQLIMLDLPSKQERHRLNMYGKYKGEIFKQRKEQIFFESNINEAIEIRSVSKKEVFCTDTMEMLK